MDLKRQNYFSGAPMELVDGYSRMVQTGPFLFCGGTTSVQPDGSMVAEGDSYGQVRYVLEKLIKIIEKAGGTKEDVYSVKIYATPKFDVKEGLLAYSEFFKDVKPLLNCITIQKLTRPAQLVEIEMNAIAGCSKGLKWEGISMERTNYLSGLSIEEEVGYSRMVKIGPFIYLGGLSSELLDGTVYGKDDACIQSKYIYRKQFQWLAKAGAAPEDIVKVKKYITEKNMRTWRNSKDLEDLPRKSAVFSSAIVEKLRHPDAMVQTEIFAIEGCGKNKIRESWGNIDFRKEPGKTQNHGWADIVKTGPFLYGGTMRSLDEEGVVVGIGDSERQESYVVKSFTDLMNEMGFKPEEMVKFKAYYTADFDSLYGETETPFYERIYKPVKPLYTGVYVSRVGTKSEIFEMEMMAVKGCANE